MKLAFAVLVLLEIIIVKASVQDLACGDNNVNKAETSHLSSFDQESGKQGFGVGENGKNDVEIESDEANALGININEETGTISDSTSSEYEIRDANDRARLFKPLERSDRDQQIVLKRDDESSTTAWNIYYTDITVSADTTVTDFSTVTSQVTVTSSSKRPSSSKTSVSSKTVSSSRTSRASSSSAKASSSSKSSSSSSTTHKETTLSTSTMSSSITSVSSISTTKNEGMHVDAASTTPFGIFLLSLYLLL